MQSCGKAWTILRPSWFLQNFDEDEWVFAKALREEGKLWAAAGNNAIGFTDTRDIADAATTVLTEPGHDGREYRITTPTAVTFGDIAAALADATERPISHLDPTPARHRAYLARSGRDDAWIEHMLHLFRLIRAGAFAQIGDDFEQLTVRPARTLQSYVDEVWTPRD